jgi:hypothetical protein
MKAAMLGLDRVLQLRWLNLKCANKLPDAVAGIQIQSCAYDAEVSIHARPAYFCVFRCSLQCWSHFYYPMPRGGKYLTTTTDGLQWNLTKKALRGARMITLKREIPCTKLHINCLNIEFNVCSVAGNLSTSTSRNCDSQCSISPAAAECVRSGTIGVP